MERRTFVKGVVAGLVAAPSLPAIAQALEDYLAALRADLRGAGSAAARWQRVAAEFALEEGLTHLNTGSIGATPLVVQQAHKSLLDRLEANPYEFTWAGFADYSLESLQAKAAWFLRAGTDEVFLTRNTTEAMNLIATGMHLDAGDEILTTDHEHPGGVWGWLHMAALHGVRVRQVHLPTPMPNRAEILSRIESGLTARTRVVSISHVNTTTGLRMPVAEIAAQVRPRGILLVCDGAQAAGMLNVNVKDLQVDAYACSGHKWLLAPKGTGLLYVNREAQDRIRPVSTYAGTGSGSTYAPYTAGGGTPNTPQLLAHGLAMDFHRIVGEQQIETRVLQLNAYLRQRLASHDRLVPVTPDDPDMASAMVSYRVQGMSVKAVYDALHQRHITVKHTTYNSVYAGNSIAHEGVDVMRLSTHIYNTEEQLDRFAGALAEVLGGTTSVGASSTGRPSQFAVDPPHPNPFNNSTTIRYQLPADDHVQVAVYNSQGQLVEVLTRDWQPAGTHELQWTAPQQATGTYFCRIITGSEVEVRKMLLLR